MKAPVLSLEALDAAVGRLPDDGLAASRRSALAQLHGAGIPTVREEDWKYTDLAAVVGIANEWLASGTAAPVDTGRAAAAASIDADWLVIANGVPAAAAAIDGVTVSRLSESGRDLEPAGRLGGLNVALLHDGLQVSLDDGAALSRPLGILVDDRAGTGAGMSQVRIDIAVPAGSKASIIEYHHSDGEAGHFCNSAIRLAVGDGAEVDYVRIQDRAPAHTQTGYFGVTVGRDAQFRHSAFDFGGRLVRNDIAIDITQPGSSSEFNGLYLVGDGQHIDNHTRVDHRVGPAESRQEYRGILAGKARGVWNGKAIVHAGADGTDAEQANHNLLLSRNAEIDAKPELEIYTDDVKCSHGTTVGQLDETALFYLRSRGLSRPEAKQLLTRAFAEAIVARSPINFLHEFLGERIEARLNELLPEADT